MFRTLSRLQDWVSCDWLYRYYSEQAYWHFRQKLLDEEVAELEEELRRGELSPAGILQEVGDVLWLTIALLINCRMPLDWAVRVKDLRDTLTRDVVTIDEIDRLALRVDHPWESPAMLLDFWTSMSSQEICAAVKAGEVDVTLQVIRSLAHFVAKHSWRVSLALETGPDGWIKHEQAWVAESATQLLLVLSVVAQRFGAGLEEVAQLTRVKHQDRLGAGLPVTKPPRQRQ